ncbi:collectrin-like [Cervus canadensis]|nr:collectrin-like [Cervus canadensis]
MAATVSALLATLSSSCCKLSLNCLHLLVKRWENHFIHKAHPLLGMQKPRRDSFFSLFLPSGVETPRDLDTKRSVKATPPRTIHVHDAENAFKVRLSIRTALGDKAYAWDTNEEYLFKAMVAFSMRKVPNRETTEISHVLLCNVTQRVSFWFVVTDPSRNHTLPAIEVQSAIRMNRNRINNAFFLNDQTLEFLRIPSTLAPPTDPSVPIWIIIFGVIFCIVLVATMLLILSGIRQHRRKNKGPSEMEDTEDKCENVITIENGIPCDPLDMKGGHINDAFVTEDERLTPL